MTDLDQLARTVKDLEYRVRALEKAQVKPVPITSGKLGMRCPTLSSWCYGCDGYCKLAGMPDAPATTSGVYAPKPKNQFCECGREHCRAPDCPSHKPDPMGR